MLTKILSGVMVTGSNPLKRKYCSIAGINLGFAFFAFSTIHLMCSGVVPQQPPTIFTNPDSIKSSTKCAVSCGISSYAPNSFGKPAFG